MGEQLVSCIQACAVCDTPDPSWVWTDMHGIAQCWTCGVPYRLFHYEEGRGRVDKPPSCIVATAWIPLLRRYRAETGCIIPSGCSFPGGQELARTADFEAFDAWCASYRQEIDALPESTDG